MTDAYPLAWPEGWPRTQTADQVDARYQFKKVSGDRRVPYTFAQARDALLDEIDRMRAVNVVLSSNFELNSRGEPRGDRRRPADEGIALYFTRKGKPLAMACDRYTRAEENMNSLRLALDAMRQLERHGGGVMMEKAFTGFAALPAPKSCWEILGVTAAATEADVRAAWRRRIGDAHPDQGGSEAAASELNAARDDALRRLGGPRP